MTLVIKNKNVTLESGEKLYRDALVSDGSVYLVDFSNRGTLYDYDVSNGADVYNLAREAMDVEALSKVSTNNPDSELTSKKGLTAEGITGSGAYGLVIPEEVLNYLGDTGNQSHNILINMWVNTGTSGEARGFIRTWGGGTDWSGTSIRANISNMGNLTTTIAGILFDTIQFIPTPNTDVLVSYLYQGVGNKVKVWINNEYKGESSSNANAFVTGKQIVIVKPEVSTNGNQTLYRLSIEDLTVSGRDAVDVVQKEYSYVNGIGEYQGVQKRPFANI